MSVQARRYRDGDLSDMFMSEGTFIVDDVEHDTKGKWGVQRLWGKFWSRGSSFAF